MVCGHQSHAFEEEGRSLFAQFTVIASLASRPQSREPLLMSPVNIFRHFRCWDHVIFERPLRLRFRNSAEHPEEIVTKISFGFKANAARADARNESLHLDMHETRALNVAT